MTLYKVCGKSRNTLQCRVIPELLYIICFSSSYLRGVVSTSAVLMAAGVGDAEATAMSAAMVKYKSF